MHYFKKNIGDYAKKAGKLTMLEHGAYTLLMDSCYDRERFPTEAEAIDWCWARTQAEEEAVRFVLRKFFTLEGGVYVQTRIAEEIATYQKNAETNQRIAMEREEKRRNGAQTVKPKARTVHEAPPATHEAPPNQEPLTNNHKPSISGVAPPVDKSGFDEFWGAWPKSERKQDKAACKAKWEAKGFGAVKAIVLGDIATKSKTEKWQSGFIEAPLVYLNNRRWEDGVTPDTPGQSGIVRPWYDSARGVEAKAAELGLPPIGNVESRPAFKDRVIAALNSEPSAQILKEAPALTFHMLADMAARRAAA